MVLREYTQRHRLEVVMGAGVRETKLLLSPALLKDLPGVVVAELSEAG